MKKQFKIFYFFEKNFQKCFKYIVINKMSQVICEFCKIILSSKYILKTHIINNKACLALRNLELKTDFLCNGCNQYSVDNQKLIKHRESCKPYQYLLIKEEYELKLQEQKKINNDLILQHKKEIISKDEKIKDLQTQLDKMFSTIEKLASQAIDKPTGTTNVTNNIYSEAVIEINNENEEKDESDISELEYKLEPLNLGNDLYIENREEDGYINVTNLCKAGNKQFKHWNSIEKTKAFLRVLSSEVGIPTSLLIIHQKGSGSNQCTWVHPYIAINIAQWISPQFDVKVSSWIYEVMLTGKIDISKTKSFQQLRLENKEHKLKIQYLTKKYVKAQSRVQYNEKNVIYVLTTPSHKKERKYILGKATNLTSRLSTYNKTDEHEVIYYQECTDEDSMSIAEQLIFHKLKDYREQANRERFILPEGKTIELFIDVIKKSIDNL